MNTLIDNYINSDKKSVALNFNDVFNNLYSLKNLYSKIENLTSIEFDLNIQNTKATNEKIKFDEYLQKFYQEKTNKLK